MVMCDDCVELYCPECAKEVNEHGMSDIHTKVEFEDGHYYCRWASPKVRDGDRNLIKRLRPKMDEYWMGAEFNATKGIDTFAEPFEDLEDFYKGPKGAIKLIGLGALVSVGIWMTKNKLLN